MKPGLQLPRDFFGRIACVFAGLFFGLCGTAAVTSLLVNHVGVAAFAFYELAVFAAVFGAALLLWGMATPKWIADLLNRVALHAGLVLTLLLLPFVIEIMFFLVQGEL